MQLIPQNYFNVSALFCLYVVMFSNFYNFPALFYEIKEKLNCHEEGLIINRKAW